MPISIIIPTYKAIEYLELCLESIYQNQNNKDNEIIVVVDGTYDLNKHILEKYKKLINLKEVIFNENAGLALATNYGFYNASNEMCLLINDDNVCPKDFDKILNEFYNDNESDPCLVPNQIEPRPSIFKPFIIQNFGENTEQFDLQKFTIKEQDLRQEWVVNRLGWTLPIFISKEIFLSVGGWDITYPGNHVSDWDFFIKLDKLNIGNIRVYECNFYHFGSKSARTPDSYQKEQEAHQFFQYKWGFPAYNKLLMS